MKKLAVSILLVAGAAVSASAATIAKWTFETSIPGGTGLTAATISNIAAEIGTGTASGVHASASTVWSNPTGNASIESLSSNFWATGDYLQFSASASSFTGITVSWDQTKSSTGPASFKIAYSTNGTTFTDHASYTVVGGAAGSVTYSDLTTGTGWSTTKTATNTSFIYSFPDAHVLSGATSVYFRLISEVTPATAGTSRVDNFEISGTAIPEASSFATLVGLGALGFCASRRRRAS